jgi:creatinine amidohydrolase
LVLPLQPIGISREHSEDRGTPTLSAESAIRAWTGIGDGIARASCRKLNMMNSHGGNAAAIEVATLDQRRRRKMLAINASWRRLGYPEGLLSTRETHGIRGGDAETSLTLAFRPGVVRMARSA